MHFEPGNMYCSHPTIRCKCSVPTSLPAPCIWGDRPHHTHHHTHSCPPCSPHLPLPTGALNPRRLAMLRERFADMAGFSAEPPFLYGSHYSTPGEHAKGAWMGGRRRGWAAGVAVATVGVRRWWWDKERRHTLTQL